MHGKGGERGGGGVDTAMSGMHTRDSKELHLKIMYCVLRTHWCTSVLHAALCTDTGLFLAHVVKRWNSHYL